MGLTSLVFALDADQVDNLNLNPGYGENSAEFDALSNKLNITHRILQPLTPHHASPHDRNKIDSSKQEPRSQPDQSLRASNLKARSAYSLEQFNIPLGSGDQSSYSHTLSVYAELPLNRDFIVGGNLYVNALTSSYFEEDMMMNHNVGLMGRYYLPGTPEDLGVNMTLSYQSLFLDPVIQANLNSTWGHNTALSIASQFSHSRFESNYGAQLDYSTIGFVKNAKLSLAGQMRAPISSIINAGFNSIYTQTLMFHFDDGDGSTRDLTDRLNTSQFILGLLFDLTLSDRFKINLSLDQTLNLISHDNAVISIGTDLNF